MEWWKVKRHVESRDRDEEDVVAVWEGKKKAMKGKKGMREREKQKKKVMKRGERRKENRGDRWRRDGGGQ